jgi:hypothetical protein
MESLLHGQPQMVFDATALLGITAWHIFPDILILGATVRQLKHGDPLVQASGVLTIGSERMPGKEDDMGGVVWSLSLAHLRFYGPPILASNYLGMNASRVTYEEFMVVALGSLSICLQASMLETASFFAVTWEYITSTISDDSLDHQSPLPSLDLSSRYFN